jgi:predicted dehydrogenase
MKDELSRRNLLKAAGAVLGTAPAVVPALGANNKLNVAWIGVGTRGNYLMQRFFAVPENKQEASVVAVCDAYKGYQARSRDLIQSNGGAAPKIYDDYHELLKDPSIDAVIIATPEHLHYPMFMAAIKAGKNVYVEKPLAHTIEEGAEMVKAWQKSGKVVQVGTQNRSNTLYQKAREMVQQGMIGDIHYVRAYWYRNSADTDPAWRYAIPPDASPTNTDWDRFQEGVKNKRAFDQHRFYQWRLYWDYSGGISTDLLVHQTDITNFVCGKTVPSTCAASGGIYRWVDDDRDVPDTFSAIYEYPDRFHINYSSYFGNDHYGYGENFMGNEGTIEVLNRQVLNFYPELLRGKASERVKARKEVHIELPGNDNKAVESHIRNFIEAVQGKAKVIADPTIGQQAAISGHMATLSYRNNKKVVWDDKTQKYHFA